MKKLKMARGVTLTFGEGCSKYLENCRRRNLREGTIGHYRQSYAQKNGSLHLRMDTNEINTRARARYKRLGYAERGIVPCIFTGIEGVRLVCPEKILKRRGR